MARVRSPRIVAAVGVIALLACLAFALTRSGVHLQGPNNVRPFQFTSPVRPGTTLCQTAEKVPKGAGGVRMLLGTDGTPGPRVSLSVTSPGRRA